MFQTRSRAFYQQATSFHLQKIKSKHYIEWLYKLFVAGGYSIEKDDLKKIVERFENHPMYIQFFCFFLWEELKKQPWEDDLPDDIEALMIQNKALEYQMLWDNLTKNQKKTLKLVLLNDGKNLFSVEALGSVGIKTASIVTRCLKSLYEKEIIMKNGKYSIQDILLKK
jgi:hypothetical protein